MPSIWATTTCSTEFSTVGNLPVSNSSHRAIRCRNLPAGANANGGGGNEYDGFHNRTISFYSDGPDMSNRNVLGTPDEQAVPTLVCNPTSGLQQGQYFNANCFQAPQAEMVANVPNIGTYRLPYIHGPRFESDDIGLYKAFKIDESRSVQFRPGIQLRQSPALQLRGIRFRLVPRLRKLWKSAC